MGEKTRVVTILFLVCALGIFLGTPAQGGKNNITSFDTLVMFTGQVVAPKGLGTSVVVSAAFTPAGITESQTISYTAAGTGGAASLQIAILCSVDGTNFYYPTIGTTVTTITADGSRVVPVFAPTATAYKLVLYNDSTTVTATVDATFAAQ